MLPARKYWGAIVAANVVGGALVFVGAEESVMMQVSGFLLLLPGSLIAEVLPLQWLWHPRLWRCCQTDAVGLANMLYLPFAIAINLLIWWAVRFYKVRRGSTAPLRQ